MLNQNNEVIVAGGFYGTVSFDNTTLTSAGRQDIYIAKYKQCNLPAVSISVSGSTILCNGETSTLSTEYCSSNIYQWILNDTELPGANSPTYLATLPGNYKVKVIAFVGCETVSNILTIDSQGSFIFIGNGNWDEANNWLNNTIPPATLPSCYEIIIDPQVDGECILNVPQTVSAGGKLTVKAGKKFRILSNLIIEE
jgi:hypothetical protein